MKVAFRLFTYKKAVQFTDPISAGLYPLNFFSHLGPQEMYFWQFK